MINIKHILSLPPDERDLEIRKLLVPKPWKHDWHWNLEGENVCRRCKFPLEAYEELARDTKHFQPCIPDPIALDWNLAKAKQAECPILDFAVAMESVFLATGAIKTMTFEHWWKHYAQPHHYLLAALKAKEST